MLKTGTATLKEAGTRFWMAKHAYRSLQAGRGLAAVGVVVHHVGINFGAERRYWNVPLAMQVLEGLSIGVAFFFVLSGIVIFLAHEKDIGHPSTIGRFLWRRFSRVYPIYWLVLLPYYFRTHVSAEVWPNHWVTLSSILLVHIKSTNLVVLVAWTLVHELMFYGFFALLLFRRWIGTTALGLWFGLAAMSFVHNFPMYLDEWCSRLHLLFAMGLGCALLLRKGNLRAPGWLLGIGLTILVTVVIAIPFYGLSGDMQLIAGVGSVLVMLGAVTLEQRGRLHVPGWLNSLGNASYAIYLVHAPVMAKINPILYRLLPQTGPRLVIPMAIMTCIAVTAGVVMHRWIERPLLKLLNRLPSLRSTPTAAQAI